jgi:hypothetical protein
MPIGFNFGSGSATGDNVTIAVGTAYAASPGYGWTDITALNSGVVLENAGSVEQLEGVVYIENVRPKAQCEFRVDCGAGTFDVRLAMGQYLYASGPFRVTFLDGADSTPVLTVDGTATTTTQRWRDAVDTEYTEANWVSSNTPVQVTISSSYMRIQFGREGPGETTYTAVAHLGLSVGTPSGPTLPLLLHHLRQQKIVA